jgi:hypothetical protein
LQALCKRFAGICRQPRVPCTMNGMRCVHRVTAGVRCMDRCMVRTRARYGACTGKCGMAARHSWPLLASHWRTRKCGGDGHMSGWSHGSAACWVHLGVVLQRYWCTLHTLPPRGIMRVAPRFRSFGSVVAWMKTLHLQIGPCLRLQPRCRGDIAWISHVYRRLVMRDHACHQVVPAKHTCGRRKAAITSALGRYSGIPV